MVTFAWLGFGLLACYDAVHENRVKSSGAQGEQRKTDDSSTLGGVDNSYSNNKPKLDRDRVGLRTCEILYSSLLLLGLFLAGD